MRRGRSSAEALAQGNRMKKHHRKTTRPGTPMAASHEPDREDLQSSVPLSTGEETGPTLKSGERGPCVLRRRNFLLAKDKPFDIHGGGTLLFPSIN